MLMKNSNRPHLKIYDVGTKKTIGSRQSVTTDVLITADNGSSL
jgi:hypothetical protein